MRQEEYWNRAAEKKEFTTSFQAEEFSKYVKRDDLSLSRCAKGPGDMGGVRPQALTGKSRGDIIIAYLWFSNGHKRRLTAYRRRETCP